jgi:hypothetical protein
MNKKLLMIVCAALVFFSNVYAGQSDENNCCKGVTYGALAVTSFAGLIPSLAHTISALQHTQMAELCGFALLTSACVFSMYKGMEGLASMKPHHDQYQSMA